MPTDAQLDKGAKILKSRKMSGLYLRLELIYTKPALIIAADPEIHVEDTVTAELFGINIGAVGDKCALVFGIKLEILNQA